MAACKPRGEAAAAAAVREVEAWEQELLEAPDAHEFPWQATDCTFLNHGGCSGPCWAAMRLKQRVDEMSNRQPMEWHRDVAPALVSRARRGVADYLGAAEATVRLVANVSVGIFSVLRACALRPGDVVVTTSVRYHSVQDALEDMCRRAGATLRTVEVSLPAKSADELLAGFERGLDEAMGSGPVRLAVFDHVSSKPAIVFPAAKMVLACRRRGVPSLVDGAHAPGSFPEAALRVGDVGADFYSVNFHKWLYAPRPAGALVVDMKRPYPWIDGAALGDDGAAPSDRVDHLVRGVYDEATRDYANVVVLPLCIAVARRREATFLAHRARVLPKALAVFEARFGAETAVDEGLCVSMASVFLPTESLLRLVPDRSLSAAKARVHDLLWDRGVEVPIFVADGRLCARVSLHVYVGDAQLGALSDAMDAVLALAKSERAS